MAILGPLTKEEESLKDKYALLRQKDAIAFCAVQDAVEPTHFEYNEERTVSVWTVGGRRKAFVVQLTVNAHMEAVDSFQPDWFQCLSDTVVGSSLSGKRIKKSVDRTLHFLDQSLEYQQTEAKPAVPFGSIQGASLLSERLRSARETAQRPVGGFVIEGLDYGKMTDSAVADLLTKTLDLFFQRKSLESFLAPGLLQILTAVECGVDLFDTSYPSQLTEKGLALNLFTNGPAASGAEDLCHAGSSTLLDLHDQDYARNFQRLVDGYSFAYIHHLLQTKEMLSGVLLMKHNLQQYLRFVHELRASVTNGTYDTYSQRFRGEGALKTRESKLS